MRTRITNFPFCEVEPLEDPSVLHERALQAIHIYKATREDISKQVFDDEDLMDDFRAILHGMGTDLGVAWTRAGLGDCELMKKLLTFIVYWYGVATCRAFMAGGENVLRYQAQQAVGPLFAQVAKAGVEVKEGTDDVG